MKKAVIVLICVTLIFAVFLTGFLFGRNFNRSTVQVSALNTFTPTGSNTNDSTSVTQSTSLPILNINTATEDEFAKLPGIGTVLAHRIVEYRTKNGPFQSIGDLLGVEGIGEKKLDAIRKHITVGG